MYIANAKARVLLQLARKWRTAPPGRCTESAGAVLSEVVEQSLGCVEEAEDFQANRDALIADLRASIAPDGPTAEQVEMVEKLLDAVPEGWWRLLPLPSCEMREPDGEGKVAPMISLCTNRAAMDICVGNYVWVSYRYPGVQGSSFDMDKKPWLNCLRRFIGESLEV